MEHARRHSERFDLPLHVQFRSTYGAKDFFPAVTTNVSTEGFGLDAGNFKFILYEYLELKIELPRTTEHVVLFGDVVWKREEGGCSFAGVQLRMKDRIRQSRAIEKICALSDIPLAGGPHHALPGPSDTSLLQNRLGLLKEYARGGSMCRVTFRLPRENVHDSSQAAIAGDFNGWNSAQSPMTRLENGDFIVTVMLKSNREYMYRFLIDGKRWENDWYAERYARNVSGDKVSVITV